jgi:localization factor PodJL
MHGSRADYAAATASDEQSQALRLLQMRQRLASLSDEAHSIRSQVPGEFKPDVERIQQQMQHLGERLSELSGAAIWHDHAAEMVGQITAATATANRQAEAVSASAQTEEVIFLGAPAKPEPLWDTDSANALTRFYETGEAYFDSADETAAPSAAAAGPRLLQNDQAGQVASTEPAWLDRRFAEIAERIEKSLAEIRPESSLLTIGRRFDQLEQRMATALHGVATRDDLEDLILAEEQIDEISGQLDNLKRQLVRLDTIDAHLGTLTEQLSDARLTRLIKDGNGDAAARLGAIQKQLNELANQLSSDRLSDIFGHGGMHASELEGLAAAAALKTAAHIADQQANEGQIHEIGQVRGLLESFISERRDSDENNASMLDTMQQAIVRVLDRIDALETSQKGGAGPAPAAVKPAPARQTAPEVYAQAAPAQSAPASVDAVIQEPRRPIDETELSQAVVLASTKFSAAPFDLNAAFASEPDTDADRFGGSPESLRQNFIADAQRAKLKAASKADDSKQTDTFGFMGMTARDATTEEPESEIAEPSRRRSGFSLRSPRTLMTILTLLAAIPAAVFFMPRTPADGSITQTIEHFFDGSSGKGEAGPGQQGSDEGAPADGTRSGRSEQMDTESGEYRDAGNPGNDAPASRVDTAALPDGLLPDGAMAPAAVMRARVLQANAASIADDVAVARLDEPAEMPAPTVGPYSLRQAAVQGDPSAQYEVAVRIGEGKGTAQDSKEAALWYLRSATSGFAMAQFRVGTLYERGLGVTKNVDEAQAWYTRAAEQGNVKAMHNLAVLIAGNSGPAPDYATASRWFAEAAERGLADSQYNLAVLLENGLGVEKDLKQAYKWLTLAANAGDADAKTRLEALLPTLSAADRDAAEKLVGSWRVKPTNPVANDSRVAGQAWQYGQQRYTNG